MLRSRRLGRITSPVFQVEKKISATCGHPMERGEGARAAPASLPVSRTVYALAIAAIALHVAFSGRYGYSRDELYYAACGQRLAWGYVDHAPLAPLLARLSRALLGDSLLALRFLPALAASANCEVAASLWGLRTWAVSAFGRLSGPKRSRLTILSDTCAKVRLCHSRRKENST